MTTTLPVGADVEHPLLEQPLAKFEVHVPKRWEHEPWFIELVQKLTEFQPRYQRLYHMVFENP